MVYCAYHDRYMKWVTSVSCLDYRQTYNTRRTKTQNIYVTRVVLQLFCSIHWSQVLCWEWKCSWSSADTKSQWSIISLPIKLRPILDIWWYRCIICFGLWSIFSDNYLTISYNILSKFFRNRYQCHIWRMLFNRRTSITNMAGLYDLAHVLPAVYKNPINCSV